MLPTGGELGPTGGGSTAAIQREEFAGWEDDSGQSKEAGQGQAVEETGWAILVEDGMGWTRMRKEVTWALRTTVMPNGVLRF